MYVYDLAREWEQPTIFDPDEAQLVAANIRRTLSSCVVMTVICRGGALVSVRDVPGSKPGYVLRSEVPAQLIFA